MGGQSISVLAQGGPMWMSDLVVPALLLLAALLVVAVVVMVKRQRSLRLAQAFGRLVHDAGFERIEDAQRRDELRGWVDWLHRGEHEPSGPELKLAHGLQYETEHFTACVVTVVPAHPQAEADFSLDNPVVICDGFDVELPTFTLLPSNLVLRGSVGQGIFKPETSFGRHNLVFSDEPKRTRHVLDDEAQALLTDNNVLALHALPDRLLMYCYGRMLRGEELREFVEDCVTLAAIIRDRAQTMPTMDEEEPPDEVAPRPKQAFGLHLGGSE